MNKLLRGYFYYQKDCTLKIIMEKEYLIKEYLLKGRLRKYFGVIGLSPFLKIYP